MKEKKCKVCSLFDEQKFSNEIRFDINKLIKSKEKLEVLNKQTGFNLTEHYYKKHRDICLLNFEIPIEEEKIKNQETDYILNNKIIEIFNTNLIIEEFRNMSLEEQENNRLKLLKEAEYLNLYLVHHQLIHGRIDINKFKGVIPKDDISSLKILTDIILKNNSDDNQLSSFGPLQITRVVNEKPENKQ